MTQGKNQKPNIAIRYDQATVTHTTQFVLSANSEEVILDCSSGPIPGEAEEQLMPIHSRHALPWSAVRRLSDSLRRLLDTHDRQTGQIPQPKLAQRQPGLPRIEDANA